MQFTAVSAFLLSALASTVSAHYALTYPHWRGDSMSTQWTYPCGGVNQTDKTNANRTKWPLDGGAIAFTPTHPWAQTFINLGLGEEIGRFNISLATPFNQTSNGTFCLPKVQIPEGVEVREGGKASIQVIQLSTNGGALYNCADIEFSSDAKDPGEDVCFNSTGVGAETLNYGGIEAHDHDHDSENATEEGAPTTPESAASVLGSSLVSVVIAGAVVAGMMV